MMVHFAECADTGLCQPCMVAIAGSNKLVTKLSRYPSCRLYCQLTAFYNDMHPHNENRSTSNMQSSQTLRATSPVLQSTSRCSQTPLELSNVLWDSAWGFSGAPESTCSGGGAFRMLRELTYRIVKFWSSWDICPALRETLRAAETTAQHTTTSHFILSYLSLLQSEDSLHHNMACII